MQVSFEQEEDDAMKTGRIRGGRWSWVFVFAALGTFFLGGIARSEYPEKPITLYVAFDPGGPVDLGARAISMAAEKHLGKPIVVENRGGGGGTLALAVVSTQKPDGYALCAATATGIVRSPMMQKVPYKPLKSFTPIVAYIAPHSALVVKSDAPWKTFKEFHEFAKKNPGKINYSTTGAGSALHHSMELIAHQDGLKWVHVPYKGAAPAMTSLLGGHVDACAAGAEFLAYVKSGTIRALATHGEKRIASLPNVPTLKELGYDFVNESLHSIVGPTGMPPEVTKKLENAFTKGMESEGFKNLVEKLEMVEVHYGSKDYDQFLKELWGKLEKQLKATGLIKEVATSPY
jgi:tripartite-type tricarboxylate transporter receptor subunit TctC